MESGLSGAVNSSGLEILLTPVPRSRKVNHGLTESAATPFF